MKWADIIEKSETELKELVQNAQAQLVEFRFMAQAGSLKQNHLVKETRKTIARVNTRLRHLAAEAQSAVKKD